MTYTFNGRTYKSEKTLNDAKLNFVARRRGKKLNEKFNLEEKRLLNELQSATSIERFFRVFSEVINFEDKRRAYTMLYKLPSGSVSVGIPTYSHRKKCKPYYRVLKNNKLLYSVSSEYNVPSYIAVPLGEKITRLDYTMLNYKDIINVLNGNTTSEQFKSSVLAISSKIESTRYNSGRNISVFVNGKVSRNIPLQKYGCGDTIVRYDSSCNQSVIDFHLFEKDYPLLFNSLSAAEVMLSLMGEYNNVVEGKIIL